MWSFGLVAISVCLLAIACVLPVLKFAEPNQETWFGWSVLFIGAFGIFIGQFAWFANPILALAWLACLLRWWIASAVIALFALVIALSSLMIVGQRIPMDEGGVRHSTVGYLHVGFYVWLLAFLAMIAGPIVLKVIASKR